LSWEQLKPPKDFNHRVCDRCDGALNGEQCSLHLHSLSTSALDAEIRPPIYTHQSAPGVVMATGNVGPELSMSPDDICTFIASDGGVTWQDIAYGPMIYEFADHGGILIMGRHHSVGPTDELLISLDQGSCWTTVKLDKAMDLHNIRVEEKVK